VTDATSTALQTIIDEFKNISPEISATSIFKNDGEIVARTETVTDDQVKNLIVAFNSVYSQTQILGNIENLFIQGADSQLSIVAMNKRFLATVSSRAANERVLNSLTRVLVPTVVKLADQFAPKPQSEKSSEDIEIETETEDVGETEVPSEKSSQDESVNEASESIDSEPILPQPPVTQFMVEKASGLLVSSDAVRVDSQVIAGWHNLYGGRQITEVNIRTLEGKATTCKFKPIKDSSSNAKGMIQVPEKIMQTLQTNKGKLVIVKPVITGKGERKT